MDKQHGTWTQFHFRQKGTNVWLTAPKTFYNFDDAQRWLRTEVRRLVESRDARLYDNRLTRKELLAESDRFEIVEMCLKPVSASIVENPVFDPAHVDAYRDGFQSFDAWRRPQRPASPQMGIYKEWFEDGFYDAMLISAGEDPVFPELVAIV